MTSRLAPLAAICLAMALCLLAATKAYAAFEDGAAAYAAKDYAAAIEEWTPLAKAGDAKAQFALGTLYRHVLAGRADKKTAAKWLKLAADRNHTGAQIALAEMNAVGEGVPKDESTSAEWYRAAANLGEASAQYRLGLLYDTGLGVPRNYVEAVRWYRLAAEQGMTSAQFNLGVMYDQGNGVPQDFAEATAWYLRAARRGDAGARNNLGVMYEFGRGVEKDLMQAHMWFNLAAAVGSETAVANRDRVAGRMKLGQVIKAQAMATERSTSDKKTGWFALNGDEIEAVQEALKRAGYDPGAVDGKYGRLTDAALTAYQSANALEIGPPDDATLKSLGVRE